MKDREFSEKLRTVERIIMELERGEISIEEGERIFKEGLKLLSDLRKMLDDVGSGETILIDENEKMTKLYLD